MKSRSKFKTAKEHTSVFYILNLKPNLKVPFFRKFDGAQKNMPNHYRISKNLQCKKFMQL